MAANDYDLILHDLQIPARPGGKSMPEFGRNSLRQIRARKGRDVPIILMTGQHQHCVDLMSDLQDIGIDGSISKPFPQTGRTLAVVIEEVMAKHRHFRRAARAKDGQEPLMPFTGGVLACHPRRVELCGEVVAEKSRRGYAWQILLVLRETNDRGRRVHLGSRNLARRLDPEPAQNTLIRAMCSLRSRIRKVVRTRLGYECGQEDVIGNDEQGYYLLDWIAVEEYDEAGTLTGAADGSGKRASKSRKAEPALRLNDKQRWVMAQLASDGKLTRRDVEEEFDVSDRTAKRILGELSDVGLIVFDRATHPGAYRLR